MRLFFALEPEPDLVRVLSDWRDAHVEALARPVPAANFHLTLAFLGNVESRRLQEIETQVPSLLSRRPLAPGHLVLDEFGYWHRPGIVWLGPSTWPEPLTGLAGRLAGLSRGKREHGRFRPHITLYRGCEVPPPAPVSAPAFDFHYRYVTLFESRQGRSGVSYHALADWPLQG